MVDGERKSYTPHERAGTANDYKRHRWARETKSQATPSDTFLLFRLTQLSRAPTISTSRSPFKHPHPSPRTLLSLTSPLARNTNAHLFLCASRPLIISTHPTNEHGVENGWRTCDPLDGPREPPAGTYSPESEGLGKHNPDRDRRVVERSGVDRVELRETKYDRHEGNPEHGGDFFWVGELAQVERSSYESICINDAQGDGKLYDEIIRGKGKGI